MRVSFSTTLFAAASFAALGACHAQAPAPPPVAAAQEPRSAEFNVIEAPRQVAGPSVPLTIRTAKGKHAFRVEVARTPAQQEQGLMFRPELAPDGGMIFPMKPPRPASFWMRNTIIPLDMIFIRADGTIARIAANTEPYSMATVDSGEPVGAVLEIAGGRAAALGIVAGDKVDWAG
jgi:uncharacterized membrane protein (UPF0127 family)